MRHTRSSRLPLLLLPVLLLPAACERSGGPLDEAALENALATITEEDLRQDIQVLASDAFEGRGPASPGEDSTVAFLVRKFEALGLEPGVGDSWVQPVPLVSITADPDMTLRVAGAGGELAFTYGPDFIAWTPRVVESVDLEDSELVFVGYGIVAPEFGWNDYEGLDVAGKTVVMLVNDPGYATEDPELFRGRTMTYYGRWTYKYEEAARQGAAAVLLVHETGPAGYPWEVVRSSWSGPQFDLVSEDDNMSRVAVEAWIGVETARTIFSRAGMDYDAMKARAATREFEPVPMGLEASLSIRNTIRRSTSQNVLARLPGTERPEEVVIYLAHWDHFGRDPSLEGDQIYNGALDNASGTAALLEVAEAFASMDPGPARSVVFLATTAEEQGLLGSAYYATDPVYPLEKTVAAINIDGLNIWGPMRDIVVVGLGNSELDDYLTEAARTQDRVVKPDAEPEKGFFYRSDHFPLAKQGVPALYTDAGNDHVEYGEEWTLARKEEWTNTHYHKPSDEYDPAWDLSGAVDDLRLLVRVGARLAYGDEFPRWREGTEFKAKRDSMMAASGS